VSDLPYDRENFCYRHPDRQSFILCQRCGKTICPACQTQASVGVHCPDCVKAARQAAPKQRPAAVRAQRAWRTRTDRPYLTFAIIALCIVIYAAQFFGGAAVTNQLVFYAPFTAERPWTVLTSMFAHGSPIHLLLNMYSLYVLGSILESPLGRARYAALYLLSGLGGSVAVILLSPTTPVLGASGAIFGLLAALFVIQRSLGGNTTQLVIVLVMNLAIGFLLPGISWQAHVGGLVAGAAVAFVILRTRDARKPRRQALMIAGVGVILVVVAALGLSAY